MANIDFRPATAKRLKDLAQRLEAAQRDANEFLAYVIEDYEVPGDYQLRQDLTGFDAPKPRPETGE